MEKFITKFQTTGLCEVNVDKLVKAWTDKFAISQYHEAYTLLRYYRGPNFTKVQISKEQADELISRVGLLKIQSSFFRYGITYRTKSHVLLEIARFGAIVSEKEKELEVLKEALDEYKDARPVLNGTI